MGFDFEALYSGIDACYGDVVVYDAGGPRFEVQGTFTNGRDIIREDGTLITTLPSFMIPLDNLPAGIRPARGHSFTHNGAVWRVEDVAPDNNQAFLLSLKQIDVA